MEVSHLPLSPVDGTETLVSLEASADPLIGFTPPEDSAPAADPWAAFCALGSASELVLRSLLVDPAELAQQGSGEVVQLAFSGGQSYVGMLEDGRMQGEGHYSWPDGTQFEGRFERSQMATEGTIRWPDGAQYAGQLDAGHRHGVGNLNLGEAQHRAQYSGEWEHGQRHGKGRLVYQGSSTSPTCFYQGDWVADRREGSGTFVFPSGSVYRGEWRADRRHGRGTMVWQTAPSAKFPPPLVLGAGTPAAPPLPTVIYQGEWEDGIPHGSGEQIWLGAGERLDAAWLRGEGSHELVLPPLLCNRYVGCMQNGKRSGEGTFYYASGAHFAGLWADDLKAGPGRFVSESGAAQLLTFAADRLQTVPIDGAQTPTATSDGVQVSIGDLLEGEPDPERAARSVAHVLLRITSELRTLYGRYSRLGSTAATDAAVLTAAQLGILLKDAKMLFPELPLARVQRLLASRFGCPTPSSPLLFRDFVEVLVRCAHLQPGEPQPLHAKLQRVVMTNLLPLASMRQAAAPGTERIAAFLGSPPGASFVAAREKLLRDLLAVSEAGTAADATTAGQVLALVQTCWGGASGALPARETALSVLEAVGALDDSTGDDPYAPFLLDTQITVADVWALLFSHVDKLEGGCGSVSALADQVDAGLRRAAASKREGNSGHAQADAGNVIDAVPSPAIA